MSLRKKLIFLAFLAGIGKEGRSGPVDLTASVRSGRAEAALMQLLRGMTNPAAQWCH